ncbi:hypothetical protein OUZ56_009439 [Daphnia magna]|uniref:Uncharacterized protein n=1 Tax=Daphnia magna TaxID=35525 RepID=A0ABR0AG07_9CRUS|nr:hypothetical protein OUZ56_009439 [Daphnia magna]
MSSGSIRADLTNPMRDQNSDFVEIWRSWRIVLGLFVKEATVLGLVLSEARVLGLCGREATVMGLYEPDAIVMGLFWLETTVLGLFGSEEAGVVVGSRLAEVKKAPPMVVGLELSGLGEVKIAPPTVVGLCVSRLGEFMRVTVCLLNADDATGFVALLLTGLSGLGNLVADVVGVVVSKVPEATVLGLYEPDAIVWVYVE